jgi:hypothetical protein
MVRHFFVQAGRERLTNALQESVLAPGGQAVSSQAGQTDSSSELEPNWQPPLKEGKHKRQDLSMKGGMIESLVSQQLFQKTNQRNRFLGHCRTAREPIKEIGVLAIMHLKRARPAPSASGVASIAHSQ